LETRIVTLGAPDQALARGEADMRALEGRAAIVSSLTNRRSSNCRRARRSPAARRIRAPGRSGPHR
jgi:hypothetical protein